MAKYTVKGDVLFENHDTKTGCGIAQSGEELYAFSPCCGSTLYWSFKESDPTLLTYWYCESCEREVARGPHSAFADLKHTMPETKAFLREWTGIPEAQLSVKVEWGDDEGW